MDELQGMKHALSRIEGGKIKAVADGDKVYLFIQDAPEELRRLADALEQLNINDVSALIAYTNHRRRDSQRTMAVDAKPAEQQKPAS
ncbi:MAG: hypothetical protein AB7N76_22070 [Planctomycetota bacterium]